MKLKKYFYAILCGLAVVTGFVSCSDDDDWSATDQGSSIEMSKTRGFILNEGSYGLNNSTITYFDYATDTPYTTDLFYTQNGTTIGDTGQDLIEEDDYLYLSVYGSNYIAKLNSVGKELGRLSFTNNTDLGEVRYMTAEDGYLYVTTYGGYVVKVNTSTMTMVGSVKVGDNPEKIVDEDGYAYCVNSGWGYDNTLSIINLKTFTLEENVEIFANPQAIVESDDYIAIQGYGGAYPDYTYPVAVFDAKTKTYTEIGQGTNIAANDGILYVANCVTDYSSYPYTSTTTFYSYNFRTGAITENFLKNVPSDLANGSVYGLSINDETGHIYVMCTDYISGDGTIYHFDRSGNYVGSFSSYGYNPKKIVFID